MSAQSCLSGRFGSMGSTIAQPSVEVNVYYAMVDPKLHMGI
jgi:hypothetical protein